MSGDRYEITFSDDGRIHISGSNGKHASLPTPNGIIGYVTHAAIRQQSRDIELLRAELAAAVAEPVGKVESSPFGLIPAVDMSKLKRRMLLYTAPPPVTTEPLFILTTGEIIDGEQDDWDIECDSPRRLDAFCAANPGATVKLYTTPPPAPVAEMRDAERYRWLRRKVYVVGLHHLHDNDCGQFEFANLPRISGPMAGVGSSAEALDVVIDAALLEIKP